jgi:hypothetical protein
MSVCVRIGADLIAGIRPNNRFLPRFAEGPKALQDNTDQLTMFTPFPPN